MTQVQNNLNDEVQTILTMSCAGRRALVPRKFEADEMTTPGIFSGYPYFDHMEVDSNEGLQLAKLTLRRSVTPMVDVTRYAYFQLRQRESLLAFQCERRLSEVSH